MIHLFQDTVITNISEIQDEISFNFNLKPKLLKYLVQIFQLKRIHFWEEKSMKKLLS